MGLFNALGMAISGISMSQARTDLVARNIGQSDVEGYTAKTLDVHTYSGRTLSSGVRHEITRHVDVFLQQQYFTESSVSGAVSVKHSAISQLNNLLGAPGEAGNLAELYDSFLSDLNMLSANPESNSQLNSFLNKAQSLARGISRLGNQINTLRVNANNNIAHTAKEANALMQDIANYNKKISAQSFHDSFSKAELQDHVDQKILELSRIVNLETEEQSDGSKKVFLRNGTLLAHFTPAELSFDNTKQIEPWDRYSRFTDSDIPKIKLLYQNTSSNVLDDNLLTSGKIFGHVELRDNILVNALDDLDRFAASISQAVSQYSLEGQNNASNNGLSIDTSSMQRGDELILNVTDSAGIDKEFIFYNTSHQELLETKTALLGKQVFEIDFSQDNNTLASDIATILGADYTVSNDSNGLIEISSAIHNIKSLTANITSLDINASHSSIPLFTDGSRNFFTNSLEETPQIHGFSMRISLNESVMSNPRVLIEKSQGNTTYIDGDYASQMHQRLTSHRDFPSLPGIEPSVNSSTETNITNYVNNFISHYASKASNIDTEKFTQDNLVSRISDQYKNKHSVNIEEEMTNLVILQNSFSANARMVSTISEMLDELLRI